MIELTGAKQRQEESVTNYINRWRSLSLKCKDRLSESSAINMCIQEIQRDLQYILTRRRDRGKHPKSKRRNAHAITSKSTKFSFKTKRTGGGLNLRDKKRLTLKEMQAKEYPFFESDIPGMFEELLKAKLIELPKPKSQEEEKVMDLARQGAILLEEEKVSANHITLTILKKVGSQSIKRLLVEQAGTRDEVRRLPKCLRLRRHRGVVPYVRGG
ncbi:hypothetical protein LIER_22384 [Lithospermum erythrorhizon]|uniref:Retrotransposon gag domain-containing protein n=1 Tax=Lithospermum erythrorhizon TaxID=34254 RepID=A0AAV3QV03_LITER